MYLLILIPVLIAAFLLCLQGRRGHPGMQELSRWRYAHRGLHDGAYPENSMAAFRAALEHGYGIELDVHLLKDGGLAVIHDSDLLRVTGKSGRIEDLTRQELKDYPLGGTTETIPEFHQVLALFAGKAPLIIELKTAGGNYAALTEAVCRLLETYSGPYCIESFDPQVVRWLRLNRPEIVRGQLTENSMKLSGYPWILRFITTFQLESFLTRPDFIACRFTDRRNLCIAICRKLWGVGAVSWTLRTQEDFSAAVSEGWIPIFENFIPEA